MNKIEFVHDGIHGTYDNTCQMVSFGGMRFQMEAANKRLRDKIESKILSLDTSNHDADTKSLAYGPSLKSSLKQLKIQEFINRTELDENNPVDAKIASGYLIAEQWIVEDAVASFTSFLGNQKTSPKPLR